MLGVFEGDTFREGEKVQGIGSRVQGEKVRYQVPEELGPRDGGSDGRYGPAPEIETLISSWMEDLRSWPVMLPFCRSAPMAGRLNHWRR